MDNSFDVDGIVITAIGPAEDRINSMAIQNDGKIVAAGYSAVINSVNYHFSIARYNSDGSPDASFDVDGNLHFSRDV